jgi:hypothetical protein
LAGGATIAAGRFTAENGVIKVFFLATTAYWNVCFIWQYFTFLVFLLVLFLHFVKKFYFVSMG